MNRKIGLALSAIYAALTSQHVFASAYTVPPANESLIGQVQYVTTQNGDNAGTIAQHYDVGFNAIQNVNPQFDITKNLPAGAELVVPTKHLLPNEQRNGIVVNLPEMRMYYYVAGTNKVLTYPIGIGKVGKTIPITKTAITRKTKDPVWIPPQDIREFNLQQGVVLPQVMPAGPDNPLGPFAIYMTVPTYLIHSTIFPESIGKRASFGCIRMFESDIRNFFPSIQRGIPVAIINQPVKVGWQNNRLFMEAYQPLEEYSSEYDSTLPGMVHSIAARTNNDAEPTLVDWQLVSYLSEQRDGQPHEVGIKIKN